METSYLTQVRRLRVLAERALARYPLRGARLYFLQHGENTTFRVEAAGGNKFLLRVHRHGYHLPEALAEEIRWLRHLKQVRELVTPVPVRSRQGRWHERVEDPSFPEGRHCDLLEWVPGRFAGERAGSGTIRQLGAALATLQLHSLPTRHRRYWDADGLVGLRPRFGSIESLPGISPERQRRLSEARRLVHAKLRAFGRRFPDRQGLIHADLHFGNFLVCGERIGAIDFDDCGHGFHAYDLAVPLTHLEGFHAKDRARFLRCREELQEGYARVKAWDRHDAEILPWMHAARRLLMLGWIASRQDNPRLRGILPGAVARVERHLKVNRTLEG